MASEISSRPVLISENASDADFFAELNGNSNRVFPPSEESDSISFGNTKSEISKLNVGDQMRGVSV